MFWNFIFYGMIAVGAILFVSLTIYRIDWARHPDKYKDRVEDEDPQKRVDKLNHYRAITGKGPVGMDGKPIDKKKK